MAAVSLPPGFRFHPTDEELVAYYLNRKINGRRIDLEIIPDVDLYKCEPWDLPEKSYLPSKDLEWYFFSPRDRKYPNGTRTNRATQAGYWKATGKDRRVCSQKREVGMKKTLVYYTGRAPNGSRTNWVMHEYRLDERECQTPSGLQDSYALCRVFKKSGTGPKIMEHYGAPYEDRSPWPADDDRELESIGSHNSLQHYELSSNYLGQGSSSRHSCGGSWMQCFKEDQPAVTTTITPDFIPSKVDVALECERLQHRLSLPALEVEDFPQLDLVDTKKFQQSGYLKEEENNISQVDILQEIILSQQLFNQSGYDDILMAELGGIGTVHHPPKFTCDDASLLIENVSDVH